MAEYRPARVAVAQSSASPPEQPLQRSPDPVLERFFCEHLWPSEKPKVPPNVLKGWLHPTTRDMLRRVITTGHRLIIELGSFLGTSTRFIANLAPQAAVIAIDHWRGSSEHQQDPRVTRLLPTLYETFLVNCWAYRERLVPLRTITQDGLAEVARHGLQPDVVYVDADHSYDAVKADLETVLRLFPRAVIVGDD